MTRRDDLRPAIYHRLHRLLPAIEYVRARPALRRAGRALLWTALLLYFAFVALVLTLRYSILPNIEGYRPAIEQFSSRALGQAVSIGRIESSWAGLNPDLTLLDVRVADAEGRPALAFSRIDAVLSWWSLPKATLVLRLLRIDAPVLHLRRDAGGKFYVAGIPLADGGDDADVSDWVLAQKRIRINGATLVWEDEKRAAPPLILEDVNFALDNDGRRHRFGLNALPPSALASRLDLRGEFLGRDLERFESWSGTAFAAVEYIDLAAWRAWVDYPVALPRGRGALHGWLSFADGNLREITADAALQSVDLRLGKDLPPLALEFMRGRLTTRMDGRNIEVRGRQIELLGHETGHGPGVGAVRIVPTDFQVAWRSGDEDGGNAVSGSVVADRVDLDALRALAAYLPLDARSRRLLDEHVPQGRIERLNARWAARAEQLETYALKADFSGLGLRAAGYFPGFSSLSGSVDATEKGGSVSLDSQGAGLDLPSVFPESRIELDKLSARVKWTLGQDGLRAELQRVDFSGADATGSAQGSYRSAADGPGVIDLTAALTRADARGVWRYMPHVVGEGARHWLRDSLVSGRASEAKLTLRGDLRDFPFLDKRQGEFLVTVKAHDAVLDYAKGWPRIENIEGELRFEGNGMVVEARQGTMLGAKLGATRAEIPDFDQPISTLHVKGKASGPTAEFLRFIELSPVGARIDHFTSDMRATGNGDLDLALSIPLDEAKLAESKVSGTYRMSNNEVLIDPALPPIRSVKGSVQFSDSELQLPELNGILFGGPLSVRGGTQKDGRVAISANGTINAAAWRKQGGPAWLERLSGSTAYRGEVRVNGRHADLVVESALNGLGVDLPPPFRKVASENWPLRFERRNLVETGRGGKGRDATPREQTRLSLGGVLNAEVLRRKGEGGYEVERGAIAVGRALELPERGLSLGWSGERLDVDAWRAALSSYEGKAGDGPGVDAVSLNVGELALAGQTLHEVRLDAAYKDASRSERGARWALAVKSREASGELAWEGKGKGTLTARLKHVRLDPASFNGNAKRDGKGEAKAAPEAGKGSRGERKGAAPETQRLEELPALDVIADEFDLGPRRFGRLELQASNEAGVWRVARLRTAGEGGTLDAKGEWRTTGGKPQTRFDFVFDAQDIGKSLDRFGYPGTMRGGSGKLTGKLAWQGSPAGFDYPSLSGELKLDVGKGQFLKLDPGAAGKLLGLISLQGLPRRITLDFKDVFSEGFAFDSIAGQFNVLQGELRTERLQIDGPSARVVMRGEVDLQRETQRLYVKVQPELGGTAALGVAVVNPVAGVATWVAHKVLQNPLNQIFGFDYLVTGSWDDPRVEKLSAAESNNRTPRLPNLTPPKGASDEPSTK